ncbi:riboflavin biosynthesis protein RibF [Bacillaceae bacterium S4-13-58]
MKTIYLENHQVIDSNQFPPVVLAIGYFDGVHLGHQQVIKKAVEIAQEKGLDSAVMTFFPHPSVVLKREKPHTRYISPIVDKKELMKSLGVEHLYLVHFTEELANLLPQEFVDRFFIDLQVKHVVAGFDFSYGRLGKGTMETLPFHSRGAFEQTTINPVNDQVGKISSTRIRNALVNGKIEEANFLLGRPYYIKGKVVLGDQRGRTIGVPTANIHMDGEYFIPRTGVYAVTVEIGGKSFTGMANLGYKPTFHSDKNEPILEVHLFDVHKDLYDRNLKVEFHRFIRDEEKFSGIDELIKQIKEDEEKIRLFFS